MSIMTRMRTVLLAAGALLLSPPLAAQTIEDIAKALGAAQVETIEITGSGFFFALGQNVRPGVAWPRANLTRYTRIVDYNKGGISIDFTITQGENLPRGGGGRPFMGFQRRDSGGLSDQAWIMAYPAGTATQTGVAQAQHDLWTTPHGLVRAALADKAAMDGRTFTVTRAGRFKARAHVNAHNLIDKVESWLPNPVLGDMALVTEYGDYKAFGAAMVPTRIAQSAGGFPVLAMGITDVKVNAGGVTPPAAIQPAAINVQIDQAAPGVWFVHGGTHHSVVVEMKDHLILFEAPLGDARTNAVIDTVKRSLPAKPIRYAVNTHHHFDHSGGVRAAAAAGITIVTHAIHKPFFEAAYQNPHTFAPDALARSGKKATFMTLTDKRVFSDGARTFELHRLKDNLHNEGLIVGYLPKEKILMVADAFSPRAPIVKTPEQLNPFTTNLWDQIVALKLKVKTVLPIHGRMVKVEELKIEVGRTQ